MYPITIGRVINVCGLKIGIANINSANVIKILSILMERLHSIFFRLYQTKILYDQCNLFNNATLIERYACNCADLSMRELNAQVIECWSRIPAPEQNPKSKDEIVGCNAKFIDEVKDNPSIPIANVTKIRRNNDKSWEKLDKIEKEMDKLKNDRATIRFVNKTLQMAIKYSEELDLAYDVVNSTLYEAAFKLKEAIEKAEKSNDEEDLMAAEIALDEFTKTLQAAVVFDNEYHWADNSILTVYFKIEMVSELAMSKLKNS
uniref:Uncharacterized protein n=1 Tax=Meloidogyne incognita TaxID=6306 RepID=A0A914KZ25_MELIC